LNGVEKRIQLSGNAGAQAILYRESVVSLWNTESRCT